MKKLLLLLVFCTSCFAEPIEFVVGAVPGGSNDSVSRKLMEQIESKSDLKFVMVYKPGAGQKIGYSYVLQSNKPTVIVSTSEIMDVELKDNVDTIFNLGEFNNLVLVNAQSNIYTITDLAKKSQINFGHGGEGTFSYRAMQQVCKNMNCLPVPFKGGSEAMISILSNTIDAFAVSNYGAQYVTNDKFRAIGYVHVKNSWLKLFGRNLTKSDKKTIQNVLKNTDTKFYTDMGLHV